MTTIAEALPARGHEELEDLGPPMVRLKEEAFIDHRAVIGLVLAIPMTLLFATELGWIACSFYLLVLVGEVSSRDTYQLNVRVSRKINALLVLEKARTGKSMPEIVEDIFREYSNNRKK